MTRNEAIMLAVTMGAAARMRPNNLTLRRTEVEAYRELLQLLAPQGVEAQMMEIAPGSLTRQALLAEQIGRSDAISDVAVLYQSLHVLRETMKRDPHAATAIYADGTRLARAQATLRSALEPVRSSAAHGQAIPVAA